VPAFWRILDLGDETRCLTWRRKNDVIDLSVIALNDIPAGMPER
jgi:hypothetical protein